MNINAVLVQLPQQLRGVAPKDLRANIYVAKPPAANPTVSTSTSPVDVVDFSADAQAVLASQTGTAEASRLAAKDPTRPPPPPPQGSGSVGKSRRPDSSNLTTDTLSILAESLEETPVDASDALSAQLNGPSSRTTARGPHTQGSTGQAIRSQTFGGQVQVSSGTTNRLPYGITEAARQSLRAPTLNILV